jgi:hypothetical protein
LLLFQNSVPATFRIDRDKSMKSPIILATLSWFTSALCIAGAESRAQDVPPSKPASHQVEIKRKIEQAKAQVETAQAALAALERELADTQAAAIEDLNKRARTGEEAAIRAVLDLVNTDSRFVAYDHGRIARVPDMKPFLRVLDQVWPAARPLAKSKLVWMLGVNGSAEAAARLRAVLASETDPDVIGNAIFALSRCPASPENLAAVQRHMSETRSMANAFGFHPHGWYAPDAEGRTPKPLRILAGEYVAKHDSAKFATMPGEIIVEPATIHCAGFVWEIAGDSNRNCAVRVAYRKKGTEAWKEGYPLLRCESWESPNPKYPFQVGEKLAGSLFDLEAGTEYEVKLTLADPDGGGAEKLVTTRTIQEPAIYKGLRTLSVVPGAGGGSGTRENPFKGIAAADAAARPGDVMLLGPGKYLGSVALKTSGEDGKPIVWRGSNVDQVILDGAGEDESLSFSGISFLHFENLSFTGANQGCIKTYGSQDVVVRGCKFFKFKYGAIVAQGQVRKIHPGTGKVTGGRNSKNWFILDNEFTGPKDWTKDRGSSSSYGVNLSGVRNIIAYNRITDFWDCISLTGDNSTLPVTGSTDVYNNDLRQGSDDGVEADYTYHNVRIFRNRLTNTFCSLSAQPTFGGPTYFLYNAMYNTTNKPFKLHVNSTGIIAAHNTAVVSREAFYGGSFHHALFRNNLLLGLPGAQGYWMSTEGHPLDMDYGGYNVAAPSKLLLNLSNVRYATMRDATEDLGIMAHSVPLDWDVFTNAKQPPGDDQFADPKAMDAGVVMPGINDGFTGKAPDLGCYEVGRPVPSYGPRTDKQVAN